MNRRTPALLATLTASLTLLSSPASADQNLGRPLKEQEERPGFFHRASHSVGGFFRRLFGTEEEPEPKPQQFPPIKNGQPKRGSTRYNLDQPPRVSGEDQPPKPSTKERKEPPPAKEKPSPPAKTQQAKTRSNEPSKTKTVAEEPPKKTKQKTEVANNNTKTEPAQEKPARQEPATNTNKTPASDSGKTADSNGKPAGNQQPANGGTKPAGDQNTPLTGTKTSKPGRVKSPYSPYAELDVSGLPSGSLALDPTTQKVFRVP